MVSEGINLAGIKRIIELESAMSNMAIEVAKLRIEVDALLESNPEKAFIARRRSEVIVYNSQKSL
jgi:MerR family transcriptional regulator/heat shock protein HspR